MRTFAKELILTASTFFIAVASLHAQDQPQVDPAQMEALWKAFATPGEPHADFAKMRGAWSVVAKDYMMDPSSPSISQGEAKFETVLDGRFLVQHYRSTFQGQPFEGMGVTGYDNSKKKYVGSWVDNMGTGIMNTEGTLDRSTNTMTEHSEMSSPLGPMKVKMVTTYDNENRFTFTMYTTMPDGNEVKSMELAYTRQSE